jgi:hypothetical protein
MICLVQVVCWWFWAVASPSRRRWVVSVAAIGASIVVLMPTPLLKRLSFILNVEIWILYVS